MSSEKKSSTGAKVIAWCGAILILASVALFFWAGSQGIGETTNAGMYNLMYAFLSMAMAAVGFVMLAAGLIVQALRAP